MTKKSSGASSAAVPITANNMSEAKQDIVISRLNSINKKLGDFNTKFKELNEKFSSKINTFEKKCSKPEMKLKTKVIV